MRKTVISVEHLSKRYDLGVIGTGTVSRDLNRWWARMRGKPDPYAKIGEVDHGNRSGESIMALDDVSFTVEQGEVLGIIGRNGAGKSTLLKILSQVTAPTSGKVKVKGRIGSLLEVGTGFHPELTGRENVYLNGAILGMSRAEVDRKFDEIVDFSGVEKFIDTPVKRYSSGMYVRLAFAVAAHLEPEILIVDEVLAVGDAEFQQKCLGKMGEVAHEGRTVLFVSHNMAAVQNLCTKCMLLENGIVSSYGYTQEVITTYLQRGTRNSSELLGDRKDRVGTGLMKFTDAYIWDSSGETINTIQSGQPVSVVLSYSIRDNTVYPAIIRLEIVSPDGRVMFLCLSRNSHKGSLRLANKGKIVCWIPKFPLLPGRYMLNIWCKIDETMADKIFDVLKIDVIAGDFFDTGKVSPGINPGPKDGVLVDHTWKIICE